MNFRKRFRNGLKCADFESFSAKTVKTNKKADLTVSPSLASNERTLRQACISRIL